MAKKTKQAEKPANPNRVKELLYQISGKLHDEAQSLDDNSYGRDTGIVTLLVSMAIEKARAEANGNKPAFKHKSKPLANLMSGTAKELGWV